MATRSHNKGIRYIPNLASNVSPAHDGVLNSGNHIVPNAEGVNYPVLHDLGDENVAFTTWTLRGSNTIVDNGDGTFTLTIIDDIGGAYLRDNCVVGNTYMFTLDIISYSETVSDEVIYVYNGSNTVGTVALPVGDTFFTSAIVTTDGSNISFNNLKIGSILTFGTAIIK